MGNSQELIVKQMNDYRNDYLWFSQNIDELRKEHENEYVLIKNKQIISSNPDYKVMLEEAKNKGITLGNCLIEYVAATTLNLIL